MINRRHFVAGAIGLLPGLRLGPRQRASGRFSSGPRIRVAVVGETTAELRRGIDFGAAEAQHSARLIGWTVDVIDIESDVPPDITAVVAASSAVVPDARAQIPVIRLTESVPGSRNEFSLHPRPDTVQRALRMVAEDGPVASMNVELWHHSLTRFGAEQLRDRYRARVGREMTSESWAGWFGVKIVWESAARAERAHISLLDFFASGAGRHDGHKGIALRFNGHRELVQPLYVVRTFTDSAQTHLVREVFPFAEGPT